MVGKSFYNTTTMDDRNKIVVLVALWVLGSVGIGGGLIAIHTPGFMIVLVIIAYTVLLFFLARFLP
ncbi:MAG: hypothetical protein HY578_08810 [Nitrospinae bacterium]|nr:hypothetical protein [Nitrospinota bacterium]